MPLSDYTPELEDVAAFITARTKTAAGREAGTFNPASEIDTPTETRPTAEQVGLVITLALDKVEGAVSADIPDGPDPNAPNSLRKLAKRVTSILAAMMIELTFFPEQVNSGRSAYPQLKEMYDEDFAELTNAVEAVGGTAIQSGPGATESPLPQFSFPTPDHMVGWSTRF